MVHGSQLVGILCICCFVHMAPVGFFCLTLQPPSGLVIHTGKVHCGKILCLHHCGDLPVDITHQAAAECPIGAVLLHWGHPG